MKVAVLGSTGRIGSRLVKSLRQSDCRVFEASRSHGVDAVSGVGLEDAVADADVVVDVSNSPSLEGAAALRFFEAASRNLLSAGRAAGVKHHIVLSIVGLDRLLSNEYFQAKKIQEDMLKTSGIPFGILRSTQFFEFISDVVQEGSPQDIPISTALAQPVAAEDVANMLVDMVFGRPLDRTLEIAGPERFRLDEVATEIATAHEDGRRILADPHARYFGAELEQTSLLPGPDAHIAPLRFDDWLRESLSPGWSSITTSLQGGTVS